MKVQFYANVDTGQWRLYPASESKKVGSWAYVHSKRSIFFEMKNPKSRKELEKIKILYNGKSIKETIKLCEKAIDEWDRIEKAILAYGRN